MTALGKFFIQKSINKASVARKTGLSKNRLSELSNNEQTHLRADELYLIARAIGADPCELLQVVCGHLGEV